MFRSPRCLRIFLVGACCWAIPRPAQGAPSVADALKLVPVQENVQYDRPDDDKIQACTIKAEKVDGSTAWVIRGANGDTLRQFADSNGDNVVDTWSYFRNGLEVYRDIDSNYNGKADQYRWFHSAGTRWGIDRDEDGTIDAWKWISPEELAEEVVEAVRTGDAQRFRRLLLTKKDISALGLAPGQAARLAARTRAAGGAFQKLVSSKRLKKNSKFSDFGGLRPGVVPAGTNGSRKDLMVYENVWSMVENGGNHQQLQLGTMVRVEDAWKLVDGPTLGGSKEVASGFFFEVGGGAGEAATVSTDRPPSEQMQEILARLEKLDEQMTTAVAAKKPALNAKRADLLEKLATAAPNAKEREQWLKQLADMVSAAVQDGTFPEGVQYLKDREAKLREQGESDDLLAYFQFHRMLAEYYGKTLAAADVDYAQAQAQWLQDLEAFVQEHPHSEHSAEAARQLAMENEMSGNREAAIQWYGRITKDYPHSAAAPMARGAMTRLTSEGKTIRLQGTAIRGGKVDLQKLRGKAVVIQYWTTSCEVCKADHAVLKDLYAKYGGRGGLEIIGVNLDYSRDELLAYLKANRLPWKQLYEQGGFDSRLASEMGVVTVPLMILVDPQGKVVSSDIQAAELEAELKKLLAPRS